MTRAAGAAALALVLGAAAAPAQEPPADAPRRLGVAAYRDELRAAEAALVAGDWTAAAARGAALSTARVEFSGETVGVDPALVDALAEARPPHATAALARVRTALRALPQEAPAPPPAPDDALLRRAQQAEKQAALPEGGEVSGALPPRPSLPRRFLDALAAAWDWLLDAGRRFLEWLKGFWPRKVQPRPASAPFGTTVTVVAIVVLVAGLLAWLAVAALRRSGRAKTAVSEPERASERDDDPLSREQDEWEAYAAELARSGRLREAIRAWYHAVLVALFRSGRLQHRKGRTNWEYVARLPADISWRGELIALTRRFDREWYGRERSSPESLRECAGEARSILAQVRGERAA